jgi:hypothetical protein
VSNGKSFRRGNPVARNINEFNKPKTHRDRTKYRRNPKHRMSLKSW